MIFYFSATGNSYHAALIIGEMLCEEAVDISAVMKKGQHAFELKKGERLGFIFPVFFYGVPSIVADFVDRLELKGDATAKAFAVITCGEKICGADRQFMRMLAKKDIALTDTYPLVMPNNSVPWYDLQTADEQVKVLEEAEEGMRSIAASISGGGHGEYSSGIGARAKTGFMYPLYRHGRSTGRFYAENGCTRCGKCARICPAEAIEVKADGPIWTKKRCVQCLACINRCPVQAIQYGNATRRRTRYENPVLKMMANMSTDME